MAGHRKHRQLGCESLENRRLMAGDVDVALIGTIDLAITGDHASNDILVEQVGREIRVTGQNGTTVNGSTKTAVFKAGGLTQEFDDIFIKMNGGDDDVTIRDLNLDYWHHSNLNADMGSGSDLLWINGARVAESVKVDTGTDHDIVAINRTDAGVGPLVGNIEVDLVRGVSADNQLTITNSSATDIRAYTDEARVLRSSVTTDVWIHGNHDRNTILVSDVDAGDDIHLYGGEGRNELEVKNSTAEDIRMYGGSGRDIMSLRSVSVADDIRLDGGEGNDYFGLSYNFAEDLYIYGRGGDDVVYDQVTHVHDYLFASLGDDEDTITLNGTLGGRHYLHGGEGRDEFKYHVNPWVWLNRYSFEIQTELWYGIW